MSNFDVRTDIIIPSIAWINTVLGDDVKHVIVDRPNRARPKNTDARFNIDRPYITLNFTAGLVKQGSSNSMVYESGNNWCIGEDNNFTLGIKAYGDPNVDNRDFFKPLELLRSLRKSLDIESQRSDLDNAGLSVRTATDILDISAELESGYESRYSMDLIMGIMINDIVDLGAIENVELTGTYNGIEEQKQTISKP